MSDNLPKFEIETIFGVGFRPEEPLKITYKVNLKIFNNLLEAELYVTHLKDLHYH